MRKLLSSLAFLLATIPIFAQFSGSGSGTESSPYLIYNEIQLAQVANFLGQEGVVFSLQKDLDVSNYISENYPSQGWLPIGTSASPFKGVFKGNGHTISGLFINRSGTSYVGFFGYIDGATINDLKLNATYIKGNNYVGAIAGYCKNTCTISGCSAVISQSTGITAKQYVGGIAGCTYLISSSGNITNCSVQGSIKATSYVGGIIGQASSFNLTSVTYNGNINATEKVGGIVGWSNGGQITSANCHSNIVATSTVGGIVGHINGVITSSYYQGKITNSGNITGGIAGYDSSARPISNCIFFGEISGVDYVGGIVGQTASNSYNILKYAIDNCSAIGDITGHDGVGGIIGQDYQYVITNSYYNGILSGHDNVGGLVGHSYINDGGSACYQSISYCYSNATISGSSNVGGLVGRVEGGSSTRKLPIKSNVALNTSISANSGVGRIYGYGSYVEVGALGSSEGNRALNQTIVNLSNVAQNVSDNAQNGTGIGPSMLKLKANYVAWGWDFDNNWTILETECFPYKKYQAAPPKIESELVSNAGSISGNSHDGGTVYLCYKDNAPVSTTCNGNAWTFNTEPLQSGAQVRLYAEASNLKPSYYTTGTVGYPGGGTESDPYLIYTAEDLQGATNSGYYKLMNDIDLTSWINANSPSAGWPAVVLSGTDPIHFDGCGHKVTGLWTNTSNEYNGLFSKFSASDKSSIRNLTVEVATGKKVKGGNYTGILIGYMQNGEIINCSVKGNVEGTQDVGGLAGYLQHMGSSNTEEPGLIGVHFSGSVSSSGTGYTGGLVGYSFRVIATDCSATATITSSGSGSVGGIFGFSSAYDELSKIYADVTITSAGSGSYVGGLVGQNKSTMEQCYAKGTVRASGINSCTGGLVGMNDGEGEIENCYTTANVYGTQYTAGLVGYSKGTIRKCYASGNVNGVMYGAGVVGELDGSSASISNCVAANNIISLTDQSSWGCRVVGGFQNDASEPGNNNYALSTMQVSLNGVPQTKTDDNLEGIAKTQAELMTASIYEGRGWDFSSVWGIDEGQTYPYLLWEANANPIVSITLDNTSLVISEGNTATITANILPQDASNKRLTWTSSNESVATVADGVVTAIGQGTAIITAKSTDGSNVSANCQVTVVPNLDEAIAELQALVDEAQALYDNSTEGEEIGQYAPGSRAALLAVINSVRNQISSTMDEATISECMTQLNNAITQFESQRVTPGEDTDYSQIDNTLYIERVEAAAGGQVQLSIRMKNTIEAQGYQFDLYLPEGVTVATDEDGFVLAELSTARTTERKTDYFNCSVQADGSLRVLCGSSKGYTFSGNDGEVAVITINLSPDMEEGEYPVILKNVRISDKNSVPYVTDYLKSTLAVSSYTLGDVNADGSVDVADFIAVANHILGNTPEVFVHKAADVNVDNSIDVADFIGIANMILNGTAGAANQGQMMMAPRRADSVTPTDIDALDNAIYVEPITAAPGTRQVLSLRMKNTGDVAGFELNLQLPDGVTIATDEDDMLMVELSTERTNSRKTDYFNSAIQDDGTLKILCGSSTANPQTGKVYTFSGNEGEVARITVDIPADYEAGEYDVHVLNAIMADADSHKKELEPDIISLLTIEENDGRIHFAETDTSLPAYTAGEKGDITMARTINAGEWSTIVLPFNLTRANATKAFGEDVQFATFSGFEVDYGDDEENVTPLAITLKFDSYTIPARGNLAGGTPVLIKTGKNISEIKLDGVTLVSTVTNVETADADYGFPGKFIGTFVKTTVPEDGLFLSGNKFWYSTGKTNIKAFRGWFELGAVLNKESDFGANLNFVIDGDPTSIDGIPGYMIRKGDVYTIQGQYVGHDVDMKRLPSGIYIVDGKKMVIK